jgi:DNA modification methylase
MKRYALSPETEIKLTFGARQYFQIDSKQLELNSNCDLEALAKMLEESSVILSSEWEGSCLGTETTLHQVGPYIGKMKSTMARTLILRFSAPNDVIFEPFVGSGAVALESLIAGRGVICCDTNPYAVVLTRAKLFPPRSLSEALRSAEYCLKIARNELTEVNPDDIPRWVQVFFHPRTLKEIVAITRVLKRRRQYFLLACLLGILHHQRPGFLSYPASHAVPYLRTKKFPKSSFPELYKYRPVRPRLIRKITRAYRRFPEIDESLLRKCDLKDVTRIKLSENSIDAVITSPPYMNALDYVRDNRLRLWFLGYGNETDLNKTVPMNLARFEKLMDGCLRVIQKALRPQGRCVFVAGEICNSRSPVDTAQLILDISKTIGDFDFEQIIEDVIPPDRRIRKAGQRVRREKILVLRKV